MSLVPASEQLALLIAIASDIHKGQFDKAGKPYILHPLYVMNGLLQDYPDDYLLAGIGICHDTYEDHKEKAKILIINDDRFDDRVKHGILMVSKLDGETKEQYQEKVLSDFDSVRVKEWDLRHNTCITRLKGLSQKDIDRTTYYHAFYMKIQERKRNMV